MAVSKLSFLAGALVLLLAVAVQAQFGFGGFGQNGGGYNGYGGGGYNGYGGRDQGGDDDVPWWQQGQPRTQPQPRPTQQQGGGQYGGFPYFSQGGQYQGGYGGQQGGYPYGQYGQQGGNGYPRPTPTPSRVQPPQSRSTVTYQPTPPPYGQGGQYGGGNEPGPTRTWSQPSAWGPPRSPFGPTSTPTGPQTIPTTTTEAPRPNVPFLTVCGGMKYVEDDVSNALITGCYYKNKTQTVNKSEYPKPFDNSRGRFNFGDVLGPFWEFPLISSAAYIGGNPGPDRVIFNQACFLAGEVTETNAGPRGLTECRETY